MDPEELGYTALVSSWLQTSLPEVITKQQKDTIRMLFNWLVSIYSDIILFFINEKLFQPIAITQKNVSKFFC